MSSNGFERLWAPLKDLFQTLNKVKSKAKVIQRQSKTIKRLFKARERPLKDSQRSLKASQRFCRSEPKLSKIFESLWIFWSLETLRVFVSSGIFKDKILFPDAPHCIVPISNSDTMRRGLAPPCRIVPFGHGKEGIYPPHHVSIPIWMWQGACLLPIVFLFWHDGEGCVLSLLCPHSNFDHCRQGSIFPLWKS